MHINVENKLSIIIYQTTSIILGIRFLTMAQIDISQLKILVIGIASIFLIYCLSGIFHEYLIVLPYKNFVTGANQVLPDKAILVLVPTLVTWLIGNLYNRTLPQRTKIPEKNSLICGGIVFMSTITYTWATAMTSFPIVMAFKSCNILSILLVAILCTRVKDSKLKLGPKKIIVGIVISIGVFFFSYFDPEQNKRTSTSQYLGIFLLFVSLLADGFLPDFQAQIKSEFKPQPTQMMQQINKWVALISLGSMIVSWTAHTAFIYTFNHPLFLVHLIAMSLLSCLGQFVIYTLIKLFKQHIVPFVITTRKIFSVLLSILFYHHETSVIQLLGMVIVIAGVVYEFASEIRKQEDHAHQQKAQVKSDNFEISQEVQNTNNESDQEKMKSEKEQVK